MVQGGRKTLVLREVAEESVSKLLEKKDALASCDVAAFVYDRCVFEPAFLSFLCNPLVQIRMITINEHVWGIGNEAEKGFNGWSHNSADAESWRRAYDLLIEVAAHQEITGLEVPCLLIASKDDLESDPFCTKGSTRVPIDPPELLYHCVEKDVPKNGFLLRATVAM